MKLVLTAEDIAEFGSMPVAATITVTGEDRLWIPPHPALAGGIARHVAIRSLSSWPRRWTWRGMRPRRWRSTGSRFPPSPSLPAAAEDEAPLVWTERPGNIAFTSEFGDAAAADTAFAGAAHVARLRLVNNRIVTNYMETRGVLAEVEETGRIRLTLGSQGSHLLRNAIADKVLKWDREDLRVVTPDVGGGFGTKMFPFSEYPLIAFAARVLGHAVAWIGDRSEHFLADSQGRDNITDVALALDADGRFIGLEVDTIANMGAYLSYYGPFVPWGGASMLPVSIASAPSMRGCAASIPIRPRWMPIAGRAVPRRPM